MSWDRYARVRVTLEMEVRVSANREKDALEMIHKQVSHRLGYTNPYGLSLMPKDAIEILELTPEGDYGQ